MSDTALAGGRSIFGDQALYERLCAVAGVLGRFVARAPHALDLARLERQTGRKAAELSAMCATLCRMGLLQPTGENLPCWTLAGSRSTITLEDAFRCALVMHDTGARKAAPRRPPAAAHDTGGVDVLVMQAAIAVDQSVMQLLRQFPLDRLAVAPARAVPAPRTARLMHSWAVALG